MNLPPSLLTLYRHWDKHLEISKTLTRNQKPDLDSHVFEKIQYLINERMNIWQNKTAGEKPPYTSDSIMSQFRFCNVYRELDRQTIVIHQSCNKYRDDFPLWLLNIAFQRFVCRPETVNQVGDLDFSDNSKVEERLRQLLRPKYGTAYVFPVSILHTLGVADRESFLCQYLPQVIPKVAKVVSQFNDISVTKSLPLVTQSFGANFKFHWTEILIDVAYQFPQYFNLYQEFPLGPGSRPTLHSENICLQLVHSLYDTSNLLEIDGQPLLLSAENWEGIGCEFRKYRNLSLGTGRRRRFISKQNQLFSSDT